MVIDLVGASSIKARTYSSVVDNRIALSNSHFARPHGIATWSKIRVAIRASMTDTGSNVTGTPDFFIGLCSGTTNIYKDATTDHCIGIQTQAASWTRSGTTYYTSSGGGAPYLKPMKRVGTTTTLGSQLGSTDAFTCNNDAAGSTPKRHLYFVDITKGSPNYTFEFFGEYAGGTTDLSASDFLLYAPDPSPSITNHRFTGSPQTLAVDEAANGTLNCVNLHWDHVDPKIELSDIAVVRLA